MALSNVSDSQSIPVFAQLFAGGTSNQIIGLLAEFGFTPDQILAIQIAYDIISTNNGTLNPTSLQSLTSMFMQTNLTEVAPLIEQLSAYRQGSQYYQQSQITINDLINNTGLNQSQIIQLLSFTLVQNNVTQLQSFLNNNAASTNQQLLNLTDSQTSQLQQLFNDQSQYTNVSLSNFTMNNATLLNQFQTDAGLSKLQETTLNSLIQQSNSSQNLTLQQFLQSQPMTIGTLLGLNQSQSDIVVQILQTPNTIFTNQTIRDQVLSQNSNLQIISQDLQQNQTLTQQLLQISQTQQLASTLGLTANQTLLLQNLVNNQSSFQQFVQDPLSAETIAQTLGLNASQANQILVALLLINSTNTENFLVDNATSAAPLTQAQIQALGNLTQLLTGQQTLQQFQNQTNETAMTLGQQLGLTKNQSQTLSDVLTVTDTNALITELAQAIGAPESNNVSQDVSFIGKNYGLTQNQTDLIQSLLTARTNPPSGNPLQQTQITGILFNQTQALLTALASSQNASLTTPADLYEQISTALSLNTTQTSQLQQLLQNNQTATVGNQVQELGQILNLSQTQIETINQVVINQQSALIQAAQNQTQNLVNATQVSQVVSLLNSAQQLGATSLQAAQQSLFQNVEDLLWGLSPVDQQTAEYLYYAAQMLSSGNISAILDPALLSLNSTSLSQKQLTSLQDMAGNLDFGNFYMKRFESNEDLDNYIQDPAYGWGGLDGICFGFKVIENSKNDYEVELMFQDLPPTRYRAVPHQVFDSADPTQKFPLIKEYGYYVQEGFSNIQNWVANTILKRKTGVSDAEIVAMIVPVKIPPVYQDNFVNLLQLTFTLFVLLMYIPAIYRTVYRIVDEKQNRAKESMRMMGMSDFPYWSSWLAYYTIVNTFITTLCWATLQLGVFNHKSALIIYIFIWLYGQSLFGLILITQSLFTSPRACAITTTVVYFGTSILQVVIQEPDSSKIKKFFMCLFFPTVTLSEIVKPLVMLDQSTGNTFESWNINYQNFTVKEGLGLLILGGLIMFLLGLYLEQVMPKTYGKRRHPCFFLGVERISCRRSRNSKTESRPSNISLRAEPSQDFETKYLKPECFEPADQEIRQKEITNDILKVSDLRKEYENGFKAVNGINLKMYSDQIFVLLGHNGAGKTTTLSLLTGLFGATEGTAEIFGVDIFNDMDRVRQIMGVCPQHDVLFELLTAQEHLEFFYDLKGADPDPVKKKADIDKLMLDVGLSDKKNSLATHLSGGNKRKLSVAIALCGGSKFVLLDEPTSGMDLQARRQLWNMLKECKKDRIVVLTTHYMDEADILGDRIGIMANGKLTCLGSSLFLKNKFGVGYNLTLVKSSTDPNGSIMEYFTQNLGQKVKKQSEIQSEMTIQIPNEYAALFGDFFRKFDQDLESLKIISYGISISTLEEVFLKVGHLDDPTVQVVPHDPSTQSNHGQSSEDLENFSQVGSAAQNMRRSSERFNLKENQKELDESFFNNLIAVIFKRVSNYRRNRRAIFNEAILPAIIMVAGITLTQFYPSQRSPSRILSPTRLPLPQKLLFNPSPTVAGNVYVSDLVKGLPDVDSAFQISYSQWNSTTTYEDFGQQVFNKGNQESSFPPYQYGSYQIYEADQAAQQYKFISWVNLTSQDATGLYPQFMYESILKAATKDPEFSFKVRLTPYPPTDDIKVVFQVLNAGTIVFITAIAYSMIITAVVSYLVVERISGLKHLQVISGMNLKAYWIGNFMFDFLKMEFTIIVTLALFFGYNLGLTAAWATYLALPFGIIPFSYVMSFCFTADSAAQTFTMFSHFFILGIMSTLTFGLRISLDQQKKGDALNWALKFIPTYSIGSSLYCDTACASLSWQRDNQKGTGGPIDANAWAYGNITADVIVMFIHLVGWSFVLSLIETGFFSWCRLRPNQIYDSQADTLDEDVVNEATRVQKASQDDFNTDIVQVQDLKKVYRVQSKIPCKGDSLLAVSNLSFALQSGECFALLGVNGAGKSTTFKSLTCEVQPTSGRVSIGGFDVQKQFMKARKLIGYCPQPNLIFDSMSVEEHIYYYARIKGIPLQHRIVIVEQAIQKLDLQSHRKKTAGTLSGGNKRKLCVALALVGNPPIIFLDEPSAGMDPEARRFMWSVVAKIAQRKTSAVVLTTHSMEEAEALSTKMGIMVKGGVFKCFGSAQHIKNKFGTGFVIEIKTRTLQLQELVQATSEYIDSSTQLPYFKDTNFDETVQKEITDAISKDLQDSDYKRKVHSEINLYRSISELCKTFTDVQLIEKYGNYIRVKVTRQNRSIGSIFGLLEPLKELCCVQEYSVSQTTLEQIFQGFADPNFNDNALTFRLKAAEFSLFPPIHDSNSKVMTSEHKPRMMLTLIRPLQVD